MDNIYKKDPKEYSNWEKFNPSSGYGQLGRFKTKILTFTNKACNRYNLEVSEEEAFYLFAKQSFFKRLKPIFLPSRLKNLYVCPFCKKADSLHPKNNDLSTI